MPILALFSIIISTLFTCSQPVNNETYNENRPTKKDMLDLTKYERAYFASGCFWCVESVFESVVGVQEVISGYAGGTESSAKYKKVSTGVTDHAEAVEIYYDPKEIDYKTLLVIFFDSHDPTTANRQGPDYGRQYRSMILYRNEVEKQLAYEKIKEIENSGLYENKVVTEVVPFVAFYPAEDYHQDYKKRNPDNPYVQSVSIPRLKKFQEKHPELLKTKNH
ncbi:MAG: peptide-methionine (S)-S-oxide reductase MsrA [Saprospiraceae bacterium]